MTWFASYRPFRIFAGILETGLSNSQSLKYLGPISDVDIHNGAKFCDVIIPKSLISRNELFERFWTNLMSYFHLAYQFAS